MNLMHVSVCYTIQDAMLWDVPLHSHSTKHTGAAPQPGVNGYCWSKPRFKKTIIIVIDALRFDFVNPLNEEEYGEMTRPSQTIGYHLNKLPLVITLDKRALWGVATNEGSSNNHDHRARLIILSIQSPPPHTIFPLHTRPRSVN